MSRTQSRKTTGVQAEAPAVAEPDAATAEPGSAAEVPRLSTGWKMALLAWVLCFVGLGAYELADLVKLVWRLAFG